MQNDDVEDVIYKESLNDLNLEQERPLVDMTSISNSGRRLHKTRREVNYHDVGNFYMKRKQNVGRKEDRKEREEK